MKKICFALLLSVLLSVNLMAGDFSNLNFIGFSKDGQFLAFEEYGTQDGSGFPYSTIYFINTEKNSFAAPSVSATIENENGTEAAARNKTKLAAAKKLLQFKIVKGNSGTHILSRLITDLTEYKNSQSNLEIANFAEIIGSMYRKGDYELTLKSVPVKTKDCEIYEQDTFMLELSLKNKEDNTVKSLQKDSVLPKGRGCALNYSIRDIYLYESNMVVFISYETPGFEGPDMRYMAVSGKFQ